jgi:small GTP-binding protein
MNDEYKEALERIEKAKKEKSTELHLGGLSLTALPDQLFELSQLTSLDLNYNQLTEFPEEIGKLSQLTKLHLGYNELEQLPSSLVHLNKLEELYIYGNYISRLPKEFSQLKELKVLSLSMNRLSQFPGELLEITGLTRLELSNNNIKEVPGEISKLKNLKRLSPGNIKEENTRDRWYLEEIKKYGQQNNKISALPGTIGQLENLERLFLSNLQLSRLPPGIANLKKLETNKVDNIRNKGLALEGNRFDIAEEMYSKEPAELIQYLLDLEKGKKPLHEAKIIFVGNGGVGKTSLVNRLKFNTFNEGESQTNGIVIEDWELPREEHRIKLHLWDFGGQQIMHASHKFFMTRRSVYVLVVEPRTEDKHGDTALDYWLTLIRSYSGDSPIVVVLNKCEDGTYIDLPKRQLKIQYPQIVDFVETSCKSPRNIHEVREALINALAHMKHLDEMIPASYFAIKEKLQQINKNFIDFDHYKKICKEVDAGIGENAMKVLVRLLNDLGIMLNIPEHRRLEETQVLNPGWLTNGVYQVITSTRLKENQGRLTFKEIAAVLEDPRNKNEYQTRQAQNIIMDMMEHFKLCYPLPPPDIDCYLIPAVLPLDSPPNLQWKSIDPLRFQYRYKTLPSSITANFIVRLLPHKRGGDYWRTGIIIDHEKTRANIRADHYKHIIYIEVTGQGNKRNTLSYIRTTLKIIHGSYSLGDIKPEGFIPLDEKGEVLISYEELLVMEKHKVEKHFVAGLQKYIDVKEVLEGIRPGNELSRQYLEKLADKISRSEIEPVIDELYRHPQLKETEYADEITLLSSRWHRLSKETAAGTGDADKTRQERAAITRDLLQFIKNLEKGYKGV